MPHLTACQEHVRALELHLHEFFPYRGLEFFRNGPLIIDRPFAGVGVAEAHLEGAKASSHRVVTTTVTTQEGLYSPRIIDLKEFHGAETGIESGTYRPRKSMIPT